MASNLRAHLKIIEGIEGYVTYFVQNIYGFLAKILTDHDDLSNSMLVAIRCQVGDSSNRC